MLCPFPSPLPAAPVVCPKMLQGGAAARFLAEISEVAASESLRANARAVDLLTVRRRLS